jgi:hypothetical protein
MVLVPGVEVVLPVGGDEVDEVDDEDLARKLLRRAGTT